MSPRANATLANPERTLGNGNVQTMRRTFKALHEGLPSKKIQWKDFPEPAQHTTVLGNMTRIQYTKPVTNGSFSYRHPHENGAAPTIVLDENGHPRVMAGRYITTTHGIEDLPKSRRRKEHLPNPFPSYAINLGKLEWIEISCEDASTGKRRKQIIRFPDKNEIVHDEDGNLHILGTLDWTSKLPPRGNPMDDSSMSLSESMDLDLYRPRTMDLDLDLDLDLARGNPSMGSGLNIETFGRVLLSSSVVGTGAMLTDYGMSRGVAALMHALPVGVSTALGPYGAAATKGVLGVVVAWGTQGLLADSDPSSGRSYAATILAASIGIGTVGGAIRDSIGEFLRRRQISAATQPGTASAPPALRPATGVPDGFDLYNQARCAA